MKRLVVLSIPFILATVLVVLFSLPTVPPTSLAFQQTTITPVTNTIELAVQASADDTSVQLSTNLNRVDWIFLRIGTSETGYVNGIRFQQVPIPPGSRILEAHLMLYKGEWHTQFPVRVRIQGDAEDDAQPFSDAYPLASVRPRTDAQIPWEIPTPPENLAWFSSPDIAPVIQEIIDRPGWDGDHALALILESESTETDHYLDALSFDFPASYDHAPRLVIVYESSEPEPTSTPTITPTPTLTPTPEPGRLAIERAKDIACGQRVQGDTRTWDNNVITYTACRPTWQETGPEAVYRLVVPYDDTDVSAQIYPMMPHQDLDVFLLTGAYPEDCIAGADASLMARHLDAGEYIVAVDGYEGAASGFTLVVDCRLNYTQALYLPIIRR